MNLNININPAYDDPVLDTQHTTATPPKRALTRTPTHPASPPQGVNVHAGRAITTPTVLGTPPPPRVNFATPVHTTARPVGGQADVRLKELYEKFGKYQRKMAQMEQTMGVQGEEIRRLTQALRVKEVEAEGEGRERARVVGQLRDTTEALRHERVVANELRAQLQRHSDEKDASSGQELARMKQQLTSHTKALHEQILRSQLSDDCQMQLASVIEDMRQMMVGRELSNTRSPLGGGGGNPGWASPTTINSHDLKALSYSPEPMMPFTSLPPGDTTLPDELLGVLHSTKSPEVD